MLILVLIYLFIMGLLIGSFLNVCIYRMPKEESVVSPPSHCGSCGHRLGPIDLVPVLSWLFLKGKCRYCSAKISPRYALVELLAGTLFAFLGWHYGLTPELFFMLVFTSIFIAIFFIDLDHSIIPDELQIAGLINTIAYLGWVWYSGGHAFNLLDHGLGFLIGGGLYLLLAVITRGGMGGGDIKLMAILGLWLGSGGILWVVLLSSNIGAVISLLLMALKIKGRKDFIPFGPFIVIAAMLVMLYQSQMTELLFGLYN